MGAEESTIVRSNVPVDRRSSSPFFFYFMLVAKNLSRSREEQKHYFNRINLKILQARDTRKFYLIFTISKFPSWLPSTIQMALEHVHE